MPPPRLPLAPRSPRSPPDLLVFDLIDLDEETHPDIRPSTSISTSSVCYRDDNSAPGVIPTSTSAPSPGLETFLELPRPLNAHSDTSSSLPQDEWAAAGLPTLETLGEDPWCDELGLELFGAAGGTREVSNCANGRGALSPLLSLSLPVSHRTAAPPAPLAAAPLAPRSANTRQTSFPDLDSLVELEQPDSSLFASPCPSPSQMPKFDSSRFVLPGGTTLSPADIDTLSAYRDFRRETTPRNWGIHFPNPGILQRDMLVSWAAAAPSASLHAAVESLLASIQTTINKASNVAANPHGNRYQVDVFGSMAWGGGTGRTGDLDIVIIDTMIPQGYIPCFWRIQPGGNGTRSKHKHSDTDSMRDPLDRVTMLARNGKPVTRPKAYSVYYMEAVFQRISGVSGATPVAHANTPIVKFRAHGLQCDITTNDLGGWYNSQLILAYCKISPFVLRPLIHALKLWASAHRVNNPSGEGDTPTMSSYCLTLIAIAYLQHLGVLPNLQAGVAVKSTDPEVTTDCQDVIWTSWGRDQAIKAHVWFKRTPPPEWKPARSTTAAEALTGFFAFFSDSPTTEGFRYTDQIVSVLNGGMAARASNGKQNVEPVARRAFRDTLEGKTAAEISFLMEQYDANNRVLSAAHGIQPRPLSGRLAVQDPFLWEKNCAANMSRAGLIRFLDAINATHRLLQRRPNATLAEVLGA